MGVASQNPPLASTATASVVAPSDLASDISRRTNLTSFILPEDGSPLTLDTSKILSDKNGVLGRNGQTSLLFEYFEGGKPGDKRATRPSVRVRVTPGAKKVRAGDAVRITEIGRDRKPSHSKRILLGKRHDSTVFENTDVSQSSSSISVRPIEVELLHNTSDVSSDVTSHSRYLKPGSDVSSMPADSLLEDTVASHASVRRRSRSSGMENPTDKDYLKAPDQAQTRNISQERIAQNVIEKLNRGRMSHEQEIRKSSNTREADPNTKDMIGESFPRRSHRTSLDLGDQRTGSETNILKTKDGSSSRSNVSRSSISNNPKLLQVVEDAIRRMILPEIETLKRQQTIKQDRRRATYGGKDSLLSESSISQGEEEHRFAKASSQTQMNPEVVLRKDVERSISGGSGSRKEHRLPRKEGKAEDGHTSNHQDPLDSVLLKKRETQHEQRERRSSRSSVDTWDHDLRERRKKRSTGSSRSESRANTEEEHYRPGEIPALPMRSEIADSDITRSSLLSAESDTAETPRPSSRAVPDDVGSSRRSSRNSSRATPSSTKHTPQGRLSSRQSPGSGHSRDANDSPVTARVTPTAVRDEAPAAKGDGFYEYTVGQHREPQVWPHDHSYGNDVAQGKGSSYEKSTAGRQYNETPHRKSRRPTEGSRVVASPRSTSSDRPSELSLGSALSTPAIQRVSSRPEHDGEHKQHDEGRNADERERGSLKRSSLPDQEEEDDFYNNQRQLNNHYRTELGYDPHSDSIHGAYAHTDESHNKSFYSHTDQNEDQRVGNVGNSPEYYHGPEGVESNVASLLDPSVLESSAVASRSIQSQVTEDSNLSGSELPIGERHDGENPYLKRSSGLDNSTSKKRWQAIRERARSLSQSPVRGEQDESDQTHTMSRDVGRDDAHYEDRREDFKQDRMARLDRPWSAGFQQTSESSLEMRLQDDKQYDGPQGPRNKHATSRNLAASSRQRSGAQDVRSHRREKHEESSVTVQQKDSGEYLPKLQGRYSDNEFVSPILGRAKHVPQRSRDLMSSNAPTPLSFSKPPPVLFDENKSSKYVRPAVKFPQRGSEREHQDHDEKYESKVAGNRDTTNVEGAPDIESKDVVALMDHLTVRDGQRNARDTELLVTLVRSAAETRNSFYDMKGFIEAQNQINMRNTDAGVNHTVSELKNSNASPSVQRVTRTFTNETAELPTKKRSFFSRALKGLKSRSNNDLTVIEDMLMQLLDEMEDLREAQGLARAPGISNEILLKESADSLAGVRDLCRNDGRNGEVSSPQAFHGSEEYGGRKNRQSGATTYAEEDIHNDNDREMNNKTPTQRSYQARNKAGTSQSPKEEDQADLYNRDKQNKRGSFFSAIPKISRWSKSTTASGGHDTEKEQVSSEASRSGVHVDVFDGDKPNRPHDDDRLLVANPVIRADNHEQSEFRYPPTGPEVTDDPRYQAQHQALTLQHPQPRAGPTHRHQSHLESQASGYGEDEVVPPISPDSDTLGSVPSLARFPGGAMAARVATTGAPQARGSTSIANHPQRHQAKFQAPFQRGQVQSHPMVLHPNQASNSPSTQPEIPSRSPRRNEQQQRGGPPFDREPPCGSQGSASPRDDDENEDNDVDEDDHKGWQHDPVVPLPRKRSPYSPGGLLAPIQERYSMELEREWDAMSRRSARSTKAGVGGSEGGKKSVHERLIAGDPSYEPSGGGAAGRRESAGPVSQARTSHGGSDSRRHGVLMEEEEEDSIDDDNDHRRQNFNDEDEQERGSTPTMSPRPALGTRESPGVRKITGPREMPRSGSGASWSGSGGGGGGGGGGRGSKSAHDRLIAGDPSYERERAQDHRGGVHAGADWAVGAGQGQPQSQEHGQGETALRGTVRRKPMPTR